MTLTLEEVYKEMDTMLPTWNNFSRWRAAIKAEIEKKAKKGKTMSDLNTNPLSCPPKLKEAWERHKKDDAIQCKKSLWPLLEAVREFVEGGK